MPPIECHPLAPFVMPHAKVLMLGSFPPPRHRWAMEFYYPNLNNDFWRIMGLVFYQDKTHFIEQGFKLPVIQEFLYTQGIGIYDVAKAVIRTQNNASDKFLTIVEPSDIKGLLADLPHCRHLITTGEKATHVLMSQFTPTTPTPKSLPKMGQSASLFINDTPITLHRLPSSSKAYPLALDKKVTYYKAVFESIFGEFKPIC